VGLVGLAFGQRVLSLDFDGKAVKEWRHPMLPAQVRAADVLEDLQLTAVASRPIARRCRPAGASRSRACAHAAPRRRGVATIDYSGMPRWQGRAVLDNLRYQYKLTIESASE
jgi:hypothetical protein